MQLDSQKAPVSVENFLKYVNSGFYNNTTFHRVIPGLWPGRRFLTNRCSESSRILQLKTKPITACVTPWRIAMARTADKDSATTSSLSTYADNAFLDHGQRDFGYAVFGKVVKGMDVADKLPRCRLRRTLGRTRKCAVQADCHPLSESPP
ncbi:peptidylprolyl isomerase [Shigella flexneri]